MCKFSLDQDYLIWRYWLIHLVDQISHLCAVGYSFLFLCSLQGNCPAEWVKEKGAGVDRKRVVALIGISESNRTHVVDPLRSAVKLVCCGLVT